METPFCLEILGVHIYYLDGVEMSNEKEILGNFSGFICHFQTMLFPLLSGQELLGMDF
jgi:hypothetical protein